MSYSDDRIYQIDAELNRLSNIKKQLRNQEKSLDARAVALKQPSQYPFNSIKDLKSNMSGSLAPQMMPANIGSLNEVAWPFFFQVDIDFGDDPTISDSIFKKGFFQVDQEACFLLQAISVSFGKNEANESALEKAPIQVEFIDRQSSRRFNTGAIPVQSLGQNSNPSIFPTSMLILPNAFLDVNVSGLWPVAKQYTGSGEIQFSFFGYRTRIANADKVLSTIFY